MKRIFGMSVNKFLAIAMMSIAFACLVAEITLDLTYFGPGVVFTFSNVWNHLLLIACFLVLLIMNIRNDDSAYIGISLFVFFVAFDGFFGIGDAFQMSLYWMNNGKALVGLLYLFSIVAWIGQLGLGVTMYIFVARYRVGRTNNFRLLRLFSLLFFASLVVTTVSSFSLAFMTEQYSTLSIVSSSFYLLAQIAACAGCIFTLNRLRRF